MSSSASISKTNPNFWTIFTSDPPPCLPLNQPPCSPSPSPPLTSSPQVPPNARLTSVKSPFNGYLHHHVGQLVNLHVGHHH